jgi:hypothetical protein
MTKYYSITDITATVYCEKKVVYDKASGVEVRPMAVREKAAQGIIAHARFEADARSRKTHAPFHDSRCFIASHAFGSAAPETNFLRIWRDRVLLQTWYGRLFVQTYYELSPLMLPILRRSTVLTWAVRRVLQALIKFLGKWS